MGSWSEPLPYYSFNVCRVYSHILFFIPDSGNFSPLWLKTEQFYWAFDFIDFFPLALFSISLMFCSYTHFFHPAYLSFILLIFFKFLKAEFKMLIWELSPLPIKHLMLYISKQCFNCIHILYVAFSYFFIFRYFIFALGKYFKELKRI